MLPRATFILRPKDTVVIDGHHCTIAHGADSMQMNLVTQGRMIIQIEFTAMRQGYNPPTIAVFGLHTVPQIIWLRPTLTAIITTQHIPVGHRLIGAPCAE